MKKIFLLALMGMFINLFSQTDKPINKGNYIIGGSVSGNYLFDNYTTYGQPEKVRMIDFGFNPTFGYFVAKGLALGISPSFNYQKEKQSFQYIGFSQWQSFTYADYGFGIGPFLKYYFQNGFLIGLNINYSTTKLSDDIFGIEYSFILRIFNFPGIRLCLFYKSQPFSRNNNFLCLLKLFK